MIVTTYPIIFDEISCVINNYSDLCYLLEINQHMRLPPIKSTKATTIIKKLLEYKSKNTLPKTIQYHSASSQMIQGLLYRAIKHWCCISFKIVPIQLELLRNDPPKTILYCVSAISMITISQQDHFDFEQNQLGHGHILRLDNQNTHQPCVKRVRRNKNSLYSQASMEAFRKDIGFYLYEKACNSLKEVIFDDQSDDAVITAIQSYFCLSFTSNLLQLPHEQRTWHYLACDTLKNRSDMMVTSALFRQCWYRWYYVDGWISLAIGQECLLPNKLPLMIKNHKKKRQSHHLSSDGSYQSRCLMSEEILFDFLHLSKYQRQFNSAIRQGNLPKVYGYLIQESKRWWQTVTYQHVHLRICYHSMQLVVLYGLMQYPEYPIHLDLLLDGLYVTLEILQGLQDLKLMECDQSTYHHVFFAIHETLKKMLETILVVDEFRFLENFAKQQFEMNLCVLEATNAYRDDLYQLRRIGDSIESDLIEFGYIKKKPETNTNVVVFRAKYLNFNKIKKTKKNQNQKA